MIGRAVSAPMTRLAEPRGASAYSVVDADVHKDRARVIGLWRGHLGDERRFAAKYDWFYLGSPWRDPVLQVLRHEASQEWAGVAALGARRFLLDGRPIGAGLLVDMAVATRHRSLGPALQLQRAMRERGLDAFDLVYGFPNPKAVPVVQRVGYAKLGDMVRYSRVLRHGPYLRRWLAAPLAALAGVCIDALDRIAGFGRRLGSHHLVGEWREEADPRMTELWERSRPERGLVGVRDAQSLRWRFDQAAFNRVRYLCLATREGGPLVAWFACQREGRMLHVRDFWSRTGAEAMPRAAIDALIRAARADKATVISMQHAGAADAVATWRQTRFVERDRRPIFGAWRSTLAAGMSDASIHLTPFDEDE